MAVKIDIISGFLGAGKTTLIRKLLQDALKGQKIVLIENEFGEIGIDGGFLKDAGIEIREMNSGCICCSLVGDFGTALHEVIAKYQPERVIIEPSGVGKLSDVIRAVEGQIDNTEIKLDFAATVVDVNKGKMYLKNFGEFFSNQVQSAGTIILSRTDTEKATNEKVEEMVRLIKELNPKATIITTPVEELGGEKLLSVLEGQWLDLTLPPEEGRCCCGHHHDHEHHHDEEGGHCCGHHHDHEHHHDEEGEHGCCGHHHHHDEEGGHCCGHHHHHEKEEHEHGCCGHHHDHEHHHHHHHGHDADEVFTSWGRETVRSYTAGEMQKILETLSEDASYGTILRAKGMVRGTDGGWIHFDMVPGEADVRSGAPEFTGRICVIGAGIQEDKLQELFGI